ncbi:MAG: MFS transporter [Geopsychrobacter sp.]|nr:MFS transporter [Geopsychrobacter sp.]
MLYTPAFAALYVTNLLIVASFAGFFLFPLFITAHGGNETDIGLLMGCFALASAACRPWISEMIDRIGRKRSYTLGSLIMTLAPLFYLPLSGDITNFFWPLMFLRVIHGIGLAICFTAIFTFIVDLIPPTRLNEGIGMFGTSGLIGMAIGPAMAELMIKFGGFSALFLEAALFAGIGLLLHLPVTETKREITERLNGVGFFSLLKQPKHLRVALIAGIFGFGLAATGTFVTPLAAKKGIVFISSYYLAYSAAAVGIRFIAGRIADRFGENRLLPWGVLLSAIGMFGLPFCDSRGLLIISGLLSGAGHGLVFPALNAMAIRGEAYELRGKVTGIFTGSIDGGAFVGSLLLGVIGELAGLETLFYFAAIFMLLALPLLRLRVR